MRSVPFLVPLPDQVMPRVGSRSAARSITFSQFDCAASSLRFVRPIGAGVLYTVSLPSPQSMLLIALGGSEFRWMMSSPGPASIRSGPVSEEMVSLPLPPLMSSPPLPPSSVSLPSPPLRMSGASLPSRLSSPGPPSKVSWPNPPRPWSLPSSPIRRSSPDPPFILSLPGPPKTSSGPVSPVSTSSPASPRSVSRPPRPLITSGPAVPVSRSAAPEPTMFLAYAVAAKTSVPARVRANKLRNLDTGIPLPGVSRRLTGIGRQLGWHCHPPRT